MGQPERRLKAVRAMSRSMFGALALAACSASTNALRANLSKWSLPPLMGTASARSNRSRIFSIYPNESDPRLWQGVYSMSAFGIYRKTFTRCEHSRS
jgi:hypothetical protein